ncbi:MAG: hypothetical protein QFX38_04525, partial [Methanothermobacter sp.]|nr:hypothetical protein [Methanothermobacter sp.]
PLAISDEYGILVDNLDYSGYWKVLDILMKLSENNKTISDADMMDFWVWVIGVMVHPLKK